MNDEWVAITDNADPMNVVVYRRGTGVSGPREVCSVPVFKKGASATDNSLIAADRALVVTNNYGYKGPVQTIFGSITAPGIERVDIDPDGAGCHKVWTNDTERSPSAVAKLSLANGLVYAVTRDRKGIVDSWYLTALDFRTGERRLRAAVRHRLRPQRQLRPGQPRPGRDGVRRRARRSGADRGRPGLKPLGSPAWNECWASSSWWWRGS